MYREIETYIYGRGYRGERGGGCAGGGGGARAGRVGAPPAAAH